LRRALGIEGEVGVKKSRQAEGGAAICFTGMGLSLRGFLKHRIICRGSRFELKKINDRAGKKTKEPQKA